MNDPLVSSPRAHELCRGAIAIGVHHGTLHAGVSRSPRADRHLALGLGLLDVEKRARLRVVRRRALERLSAGRNRRGAVRRCDGVGGRAADNESDAASGLERDRVLEDDGRSDDRDCASAGIANLLARARVRWG